MVRLGKKKKKWIPDSYVVGLFFNSFYTVFCLFYVRFQIIKASRPEDDVYLKCFENETLSRIFVF